MAASATAQHPSNINTHSIMNGGASNVPPQPPNPSSAAIRPLNLTPLPASYPPSHDNGGYKIMIDPTDPVRRYQPNQQVQLKLSNGTWIPATIGAISRPSPNAATQTYTVEYVSGGRREFTSVGPSYLRPTS